MSKNFWKIDIRKVQPGDLIFTREKSKASYIVRFTTMSEYSHVLIAGVRTSVEATGDGGVYLCNLDRKKFKSKGDVRILRHKTLAHSPNLQKTVFSIAESFSGGVYDTTAAVNSHPTLRGLTNSHPSNFWGFYCSKLASISYLIAGIDLFDGQVDVIPKELYQHGSFEVIDDILYEANDNSFDPYAGKHNWPNELAKRSVGLIKSIREKIPHSRNTVHTLNTLYSFAVEFPKYDQTLLDLAKKSNFYVGLLYEKQQNPYRYDISKFKTGIETILKASNADTDTSNLKKFIWQAELPQLKGEIKKFLSYYKQFDDCLKVTPESEFFKFLKFEFILNILKDLNSWLMSVFTVIGPNELCALDKEVESLKFQLQVALAKANVIS